MALLNVICIGIILAVAYVHAREGLFFAATTLFSTVVAGLVAFGLFEPLSAAIGDLGGYQDAISLAVLFGLSLGGLRLATINLVPEDVVVSTYMHQLGGAGLGLLTGYLASGFLVCLFQTLPGPYHFLGFEPTGDKSPPSLRTMPPDHAWLRLMRQANHSLRGDDIAPMVNTFEYDRAQRRKDANK